MKLFYGSPPGGAAGGGGGGGINANFDEPSSIELQILKTLHVSRHPVYDGPTLLYHEWNVEVIGRYNPFATSYVAGAIGGNPIFRQGSDPATTDSAIRDRLMTPRRQLHLFIGNSLLVSSPAAGFPCDPKLGPFPYRADILQITGDKHADLRFGIRFFVNPCTSVVNPTATILSHRWTQERIVDQDGFATLTTNGHAIFDASKLQFFGAVPDEFIDGMLRPLEGGFRRDSVQVVAHEDGSELQYCLVDRQTPMSIANSVGLVCSRIECYHTSSISRLGVTEGMEQGFESGARIGRSLLGDSGDALGIQSGAKALGVMGFALAGAGLGGFRGGIPTEVHNVLVRVWGHRNSPKRNLETICRAIVDTLLVNSGYETDWKIVAGFDISIMRDVAGRFVQVSATWRSPPIRNLIKTLEALGGAGGAEGKLIDLTADQTGLAGPALAALNEILRRKRAEAAPGGGGGGDLPPDVALLWPKTPPTDDVIHNSLTIGGVSDGILLSRHLLHPGIPGHVAGSEVSRGDWVGRIAAQILTITCQTQPTQQRTSQKIKTATDTGGLPLAR